MSWGAGLRAVGPVHYGRSRYAYGTATDGPLSEAVGTLVMVFHHKCHFAHKRRQALMEAKAADPSIVDKVSGFYAQHTTLCKTLGGAALSICLAKVAQRTQA